MLVTDGGQLIRVPVGRHPLHQPRRPRACASSSTAEGEKVVSVERISEPESDESGENEGPAISRRVSRGPW